MDPKEKKKTKTRTKNKRGSFLDTTKFLNSRRKGNIVGKTTKDGQARNKFH